MLSPTTPGSQGEDGPPPLQSGRKETETEREKERQPLGVEGHRLWRAGPAGGHEIPDCENLFLSTSKSDGDFFL